MINLRALVAGLLASLSVGAVQEPPRPARAEAAVAAAYAAIRRDFAPAPAPSPDPGGQVDPEGSDDKSPELPDAWRFRAWRGRLFRWQGSREDGFWTVPDGAGGWRPWNSGT